MIDFIKFNKKIVMTAAVTGSITTKEQNPYLPVTPEEVAEECYQSWLEGASIAHIHARHPDEQKTDVEALGETVERIREKCGDMIIQIGTGVRDRFGNLRTDEQRLELLNVSPRPDQETINAGTFDFQVLAKTSPAKTGFSWTFYNTPQLMENFAKGMKERNIGIEFECYDIGHIWNVLRMYEREVIDDNDLHFNIVMGIGGGMPPTPQNLHHAINMLPDKAHKCAMAPSRHEYPICALGAILGTNVRVGLEDNVYITKGVLSQGNRPIVAKMKRILNDMGFQIAGSTEARDILNIPFIHK